MPGPLVCFCHFVANESDQIGHANKISFFLLSQSHSYIALHNLIRSDWWQWYGQFQHMGLHAQLLKLECRGFRWNQQWVLSLLQFSLLLLWFQLHFDQLQQAHIPEWSLLVGITFFCLANIWQAGDAIKIKDLFGSPGRPNQMIFHLWYFWLKQFLP